MFFCSSSFHRDSTGMLHFRKIKFCTKQYPGKVLLHRTQGLNFNTQNSSSASLDGCWVPALPEPWSLCVGARQHPNTDINLPGDPTGCWLRFMLKHHDAPLTTAVSSNTLSGVWLALHLQAIRCQIWVVALSCGGEGEWKGFSGGYDLRCCMFSLWLSALEGEGRIGWGELLCTTPGYCIIHSPRAHRPVTVIRLSGTLCPALSLSLVLSPTC